MNLYKNLKNILLITPIVIFASCDKENLSNKNPNNIQNFNQLKN